MNVFVIDDAALAMIKERIRRALTVGAVFEPHHDVGWEEGTAHRRAVAPIPLDDDLRKLLVVVLQASLFVDEGRRAAYQIVIGDRIHFPEANVAEIEPSLELGVETLGKLAICTNAREGAVAVSADGRHIWAVLGYSKGSGRTMFPLTLRIEVHGPGAVSVFAFGTEIIRFKYGRVSHLDDSLFAAPISLIEVRRALGLPESRESPEKAMIQIAQNIVRLGHGGTLLVADGDVDAHVQTIKYRIGTQSRGELAACWTTKVAAERQLTAPGIASLPGDSVPAALSEALDRAELHASAACETVARLSQTDGAVLLTSTLELVAFGVFVKTGTDIDSEFEIRRGTSWMGPSDVIRLEKTGGARHQSALHFVANHPKAIAFVASQDGTLSLVLRRSSVLVIVQLGEILG